MSRFLLSIIFVGSVLFASAQTTLECLTVGNTDGSVSLKFSAPSGTDYYKIYRAESIDGPYEWIHTTVNALFSTYLDNSINAATKSYSYYVESFDNNVSTGTSQKIRTLFLAINNPANGLLNLSWNDLGISSSQAYQIWIKDGSGLYELEDYTNTESYTDTLDECEQTRYYQIRIETNGCESISNAKGDLYGDLTRPDPVVPKNANIDLNTGKIHLSWLLPSENNADILKYQIWIINEDGGSTSFPEAEVYGYENLSIIMESEFVCDTALTFAITAQDSCGNSSTYDYPEYYIRTLNLKGTEYNICNDACLLMWDSVYSWQDVGLAGIRVYLSEEDGDFEIATTVDPTATSAVIEGFERDVKYEFYIEAYSEDNKRTSTSCTQKIVGRKPTVTDYTWLRSVSVVDGEVHLKWQVDSIAYIPQYAISYSSDGLDFDVIDTIEGSEDTLHYFTDKESLYYQSPQYYQINPYDSCMNLGDGSNISMSIYTKVTSYGDGEALIEWTPYELMDSMLYYQVYRVIDTLIYSRPVGEVNPWEYEFVDNYGGSVSPSSKIGYFVEAVGYFSDSMTVQDTARSNTNYLAKVSNVFLPSGFKPTGITQIYKPIYTGIKNENYNFQIVNRWGMLVFEAHQPVLGWDGKYQGEYVTPGPYAYVVDYETIYGKKKRKSGIFFVL